MIEPPCWQLQPSDLSAFIAEIGVLSPTGAVLCLEGVIAEQVERYLQARPSRLQHETNQGFLSMRPKLYFMPINAENLRGLATLSENHAEPEVCDSLRVYDDETLILSWHDVPDDPIYVASTIDARAVSEFCKRVDCEYAFCPTAC